MPQSAASIHSMYLALAVGVLVRRAGAVAFTLATLGEGTSPLSLGGSVAGFWFIPWTTFVYVLATNAGLGARLSSVLVLVGLVADLAAPVAGWMAENDVRFF